MNRTRRLLAMLLLAALAALPWADARADADAPPPEAPRPAEAVRVVLADGTVLSNALISTNDAGGLMVSVNNEPRQVLFRSIDRIYFQEPGEDHTELTVDNDGVHEMREQTGSIKLRKGLHRVYAAYFQAGNSARLDLYYSMNGERARRSISSSQLHHLADGQPEPETAGVDKDGYRLPEDPKNPQRGLKRTLHHAPDGFEWVSVRQIADLPLVDTQVETRPSAGGTRPQNYGKIFNGFFQARQDGDYTIRLRSDDGAVLGFGPPPRWLQPRGSAGPTWQVRTTAEPAATLRGGLTFSDDGKASVEQKPLPAAPAITVNLPAAAIREAWRQSALDEGEIDRTDEGTEADHVYVRTDGGVVRRVSGVIAGLGPSTIRFVYRDKEREIKTERVLGIVRNLPVPDDGATQEAGPSQLVRLVGGSEIVCKVVSIDGKAVRATTPWGQELTINSEAVALVDTYGGDVAYLTTAEPVQVETVAYFDTIAPPQNFAASGGPAELLEGGLPVERGIAVQPRTRITWEVRDGFDRFLTGFALLPGPGDKGNVDIRILADGKPQVVRKGITRASGLVLLEADISGAKRLTLEVDFGQNEHIGDFGAWVRPRLVRSKSPEAAKE